MAYFQVRTVSFTVGILRWRFYFCSSSPQNLQMIPILTHIFRVKFPPGVLRENSAVAPNYRPVNGFLTGNSCQIAIGSR